MLLCYVVMLCCYVMLLCYVVMLCCYVMLLCYVSFFRLSWVRLAQVGLLEVRSGHFEIFFLKCYNTIRVFLKPHTIKLLSNNNNSLTNIICIAI